MPNELTIVISVAALAFTVFQGISTLKRNQKMDTKSAASELTTVIVKLENIGTGVSDIKYEMNGVKESLREDRERIVKLESFCSIHGFNNEK